MWFFGSNTREFCFFKVLIFFCYWFLPSKTYCFLLFFGPLFLIEKGFLKSIKDIDFNRESTSQKFYWLGSIADAQGISPCFSTWRLSEPRGGQEWLTVPAELQQGVLTPEEVLRRQLAQMGSAGDRYAYVTFEGNARGLPRRIRATLYSSPAWSFGSFVKWPIGQDVESGWWQ